MDKTIPWKKRLLTEFLKQPLSDPLSNLDDPFMDESSKRKKVKQVAQAIQHYGKQTTKFTKDSISLCNEIKFDPEIHSWQQVKMFRICVHGNNQVLNQGDMVKTFKGDSGIIQYFTKHDDTVQIHISICLTRSSLPADWQLFIEKSNPEPLICSDENKTISLGDVISFVFQTHFTLSKLRIIGGTLKPMEEANIQNFTKFSVETYLITKSKLLHLHPIVIAAARFISFFMDPQKLKVIILNDFYPFRASLSNDTENEKLNDFSGNLFLNPMNRNEEVCSFCNETKRIVSFDTGSDVTCESCYVAFRTLFNIFATLEKLRHECQTSSETVHIKEYSKLMESLQILHL